MKRSAVEILIRTVSPRSAIPLSNRNGIILVLIKVIVKIKSQLPYGLLSDIKITYEYNAAISQAT